MHLPRHDEVIAAVRRPPHLEQVVQRALLVLQKSHLATTTTASCSCAYRAELDILARPLEDAFMYILCIERVDATLFQTVRNFPVVHVT